ncbi:cation:proton antiporter [Asticcacaulis sp. 201]|uniref:cation:proton antiporter domain-containing protein n=1 Tax=Asticcacaulis sp. 201 TaxID=3028787 RepID=UPI0029163F80|nr:cation:proton antiporter [Asticcacaulis sp. 201]MDV6331814.1 cation:proton antiporter [Asticcacaulis sp. 201]
MTTIAKETLAPVLNVESQGYYIFIIVFLLASAVVVPIFQRYKVSSVLGFLLIGVLFGPDVMGRAADVWPVLDAFDVIRSHTVHQLAELGVVFLLFSIGLELTFERLKSMRRLVFGLGALQVLLSSVALTAMFLLLGQPVVASIALGMAIALSSTAVVIPVLADRKALKTTSGRSVFAVLLAQDLAVAPIMITVVMLAGGAATVNGGGGLSGLLTLIPALIGIGALVVLGRWLLRPLFNTVAFSRSRELFMAACLLCVLVAGQISVMAGLSMGLGAFVAGVLLAETEYRREIEMMVDPFKGLLLGLFFVTVGARLEIGAVLENPVLVLGLAAGLILVKAAVIYPIARYFGLNNRSAIETAAVLGPAGEFAFVIIDEAIGHKVMSADIGQSVILAAIISLFCIPFLAAIAGKLAKAVTPETKTPVAPEIISEKTSVLVVGFGRVGELVTDMLKLHGIDYTVIDINPQVTQRARGLGIETWYGDASNPEFLLSVGLERVRAVVVTASNPAFTDQVVKTVRGLREDVHIIARARDASHAQRLYQMGATDAVPETIEASLQLAENTLIDLGVPMGLVLASVHERRDVFRKMFGIRKPTSEVRKDRSLDALAIAEQKAVENKADAAT